MTASMTTLSSRCFVMSTTERRHSVSPEEIQPFGFGEVFRYKHPHLDIYNELVYL